MGLPIPVANTIGQVIVEGVIDDVTQDINIFYLKCGTPAPLLLGTDATALLNNFIAAYRANMIGLMVTTYRVLTYKLNFITGVVNGGLVGGPLRPVLQYDTQQEFVAGVAADVGTRVIPAAGLFPDFVAAYVRLIPAQRRRGFFKACGNRFGPLPEDATGASKNILTPVDQLAFSAGMSALNAVAFSDGIQNWKLAVFSPVRFLRAPIGIAFTIRDAGETIGTAICSPYVTTQRSRKLRDGGT